ncbi:MAG: 3-hexulose-6-phosphate synthase [candidate division TM6 bacterium GW2011_GWF2_28_16]|nr:MAG: 3-hexulose-6-phosphate synthase [candidate division TM6 bacterium GW2011_GWF2_28_16]
MKLQVSFDINDLENAIFIAKQVYKFADILEVGSTLINKYGLESVKRFKKEFPEKTIYADVKLIDRIEDTIIDYAAIGANYISVLAGTTNNIIHTATQIAHENKCKIALDLVDSHSLGQSAMDSKALDIDAIIFHGPHEAENLDILLEEWENVSGNTDTPIFISGITKENINKIISLDPAGIIIGTEITHSNNPAKEAEFFKNLLNNK